MIKIIVFDLDDTLFPEHEFVLSGFHAVSNWLLENCSVSGFYEIAQELFQSKKRGKIFNLALDQLEIKHDTTLIQELVKVYREHNPNIHLHEDAAWAINYFRKHKKMGMITDGYLKTQKNKVKALNISSNFDAVIYSDSYGRENWKPSLLPYQKLMEVTKCQGNECLYIGDNPQKDFVTAKKLGWRTIRIKRQGGEYSDISVEDSYAADIDITSLFCLEEVLSYFSQTYL